MKGRDLIRNAEIKKFYDNFIKRWEIAYSTYYDRTGKVIGSPLVIKDADGQYFEYFDYVGTDRRNPAESDLYFRDPRRFKIIERNVSDNNGWIGNQLIGAGIDFPEPTKGYPNVYDLSASEIGKTTVIITFGADAVAENESATFSCFATGLRSDGKPQNEDKVVGTNPQDCSFTGHDNAKGNFMLILNLPYDVAAQIDKFIDGEADGTKGNFVCVKRYTQPVDISDIPWSDAIDVNVDGLGTSYNCGGSFGWGGFSKDDGKYYYVTALYKLGL